MAGAGKKWAIGCGTGCGFVLLLLVGFGTCSYVGVRKVVTQAEGIEASFEELDEHFGHSRDFTPELDGTIPAERMEVFLAAREAMAPAGEQSALLMARLEDKSMTPGPKMVLAKIQAGVRFIPAMLAFVEERNRTLVEYGMGLGEYQYIYASAFFAYLGEDPADGPSFRMAGDEDDEDAGPVRWGVHTGDSDSGDVREDRDKEVRRYLNRSLGEIARNQLEALDLALAAGGNDDLRPWRDELALEVDAMDREPRRVLWDEGLPDQLRDSLEPYRDRLAASYGELMNAVELGLVNHQ